MEKQNLQNIIDQLESANSKEDAYFGIFDFGGETDESFIKANKEGLELFAIGLLKASRDAEEMAAHEDDKIYTLDAKEDWIDEESTTVIHYIETSLEKRGKVKHEPKIDSWKNQAIAIGCYAVLILIVVAAIIGFKAMGTWLFG